MADSTKFVALKPFQWSTPSAPNPRLSAPVSSTATTLTFTSAPLDESGAVITEHFIMGAKDNNGYVENIYVPAGALSVDGLTATGVTRGVGLTGLDFNTEVAGNAVDLPQDAPVSCNVDAVTFQMMQAALQGTIASGGENWKIGNEADNDITVTAANGDANEPFWRYDSATNAWIYSNDGVSSTPFGTGAGVTGGDGIAVTSGDIDVDTSDTTTFVKTSSGAGDEDKVPTLNASGQLAAGFIDPVRASNVPAGEAVDGSSTPQAVYISDGAGSRTAGRFYKADSNDSTNETQRIFGFITENASSVGTNYSVTIAGVVSGFSGLTPGVPYYLSSTAGAITATGPTASSDNTLMIGVAVSATELQLFNSYKPAPIMGKADVDNVAISMTSDVTVTTMFPTTRIWFTLYMAGFDAASGNATAANFTGYHDGTNIAWTKIGRSSAGALSLTHGTTAPSIAADAGTNRSTVTLTVNSITDTTVVFRLTNVISAGSGSGVNVTRLRYTIYPN